MQLMVTAGWMSAPQPNWSPTCYAGNPVNPLGEINSNKMLDTKDRSIQSLRLDENVVFGNVRSGC